MESLKDMPGFCGVQMCDGDHNIEVSVGKIKRGGGFCVNSISGWLAMFSFLASCVQCQLYVSEIWLKVS